MHFPVVVVVVSWEKVADLSFQLEIDAYHSWPATLLAGVKARSVTAVKAVQAVQVGRKRKKPLSSTTAAPAPVADGVDGERRFVWTVRGGLRGGPMVWMVGN